MHWRRIGIARNGEDEHARAKNTTPFANEQPNAATAGSDDVASAVESARGWTDAHAWKRLRRLEVYMVPVAGSRKANAGIQTQTSKRLKPFYFS